MSQGTSDLRQLGVETQQKAVEPKKKWVKKHKLEKKICNYGLYEGKFQSRNTTQNHTDPKGRFCDEQPPKKGDTYPDHQTSELSQAAKCMRDECSN